MADKKIIIISGPTATGKSRLAIELALWLRELGYPAEIISADSAQVYRYMDIGTDKLPSEERKGIPHHLIDVVEPDQPFDAMKFRTLALKEIERIGKEGGIPIIVGGTGFWIRVLIYGLFTGPGRSPEIRAELKKLAEERGRWYLHQLLKKIDPASAQRIHPNDIQRLIRALEVYQLTGKPLSKHFGERASSGLNVLHFALNFERNLLYQRINQRVDEMMERGFLEEVKRLREMGYGPELESQKIIGYRQLHSHLDGRLTLEKAVHEIKKQTRHYARRQLVWLRGEKNLIWLDPFKEKEKIFKKSQQFIKEEENE